MLKKSLITALAFISAICLFSATRIGNTKNNVNAEGVALTENNNITLSETKLNVSKTGDKMLLVTAINNATEENLANVSALGYKIANYDVTQDDRADTTKYYSTITIGENGTKQTAKDMGFNGADENSKLIIWEIAYNPLTTYDITAYATTKAGEILGTQRTNQLTVTFKNGDEVLSESKVNYGNKLTELPVVPDKEGFENGKWMAGSEDFTIDTVVKSNLTVNTVYTDVKDIYKLVVEEYKNTYLVNSKITMPKATLNTINPDEVTDKVVDRRAKYVYATGGEEVVEGDEFTPTLSGTLTITYSAYNGIFTKSIEIKVNANVKENVLLDTSTKDVMLQKWAIGPQGSIKSDYVDNDGAPYVKLTFGQETTATWHQIYFAPHKARDFYKKYKYIKVESMVVGAANQIVKQACFDLGYMKKNTNEWHTFYVPISNYISKCKGPNGAIELDSLKLKDKWHGTVTEVRVRNIEGVNENPDEIKSLLEPNNLIINTRENEPINKDIPVTMLTKEDNSKFIHIDFDKANPKMGDGQWIHINMDLDKYFVQGKDQYFVIKAIYNADRTIIPNTDNKKGETFEGVNVFGNRQSTTTNQWTTVIISKELVMNSRVKDQNLYVLLESKVMRISADVWAHGTIRSIDIAEISLYTAK